MLPKEIKFRIANRFYNYGIIDVGEVRVPSGQELEVINWQGMFPGKAREFEPYVREWKDPRELYMWVFNKKAVPGESKKLRLLVTETPINIDVYLDNFDGTFSGGYGDYTYQINFIQAKDLKIYASGSGTSGDSTAATAENQPQGTERSNREQPRTHTVVSGDTLWAIAQKYLGAGSKYPQIYELNKDTIEAEAKRRGLRGSDNGHWIFPGTVLKIPD